MRTRSTSTILAIAAALIALTGCSAETAPPEPAATAGDVVTIEDAWVKAADAGMSAAFGTLVNSGTEDVTVVSGSSPASAEVELHETVANESGAMIMRPKEGGFTIPAGGTLTLKPGGSHIMLMGLTEPIMAGEEVSLTLTFADGSTYDILAPAKDYSGANENYEGGETDMGGNH